MAKRIVEETLANGEKRYSVQKNTILGIPAWWHTMSFMTDDCIHCEATFDTIDKAISFCGLDKQVVNSEILEVKPTSIKDMMSKDKLAEEDLINLRGSLNIFSNTYGRKIKIEEHKAIACVQRAIDRMLGV